MRRRTRKLSILATAIAVALSLLLVQVVAAYNGCNPPMDVVFVIDDTSSMGGAIGNVKSELAGILDLIVDKSAGDYQMGLVTFKDSVTQDVALASGNRAAVEAAINGLTVSGGGGTPESSNTAVYDVVNETGASSGGWRDGAIKVVILVTDAPPGGAATIDQYDDPEDPDLAHQAADDAAAADILIGSVLVGSNSTAQPIMLYYATATGGQFVQTPSSGSGTGQAFIRILETLETDLEISKYAYAGYGGGNGIMSNADVIAGEELYYDVQVYNHGPGDAQNVVVVDTLPPDVIFLESDAGCTGDGGNPEVVTCVLERLDCSDWWQFTLKTRVDPGAVRLDGDGVIDVVNSAVVSADNPETDPEDNTATAHAFIQEAADLMVTKVSKPDHTVPAGESFFYTIYVDNLGPSWARGVYIDDDMVASDEFTVEEILDDPLRSDECVKVPATAPQTGTIIRCELLEPLEPVGAGQGSGRWRIQIEVTADETQDVDNLVRVYTGPNDDESFQTPYESGTPDPDTSNNEALDFISVLDVADLELGKRSIPRDFVTAGEMIRYQISITNTGPSTAFNVVVADNMPAESEIFAVDSSDGDCIAGTPGDPADPTTCVIDKLWVGETNTMSIWARVAPDVPVNPLLPCDQPAPFCRSRIFNDAWVVSDEIDPDMSNNLETWDVDVKYSADLQVFKSDIPDVVAAGEEVTYEVIVNNAGPSTARDVVMVDTLPDEVEFLSATILDDQMGSWDCALTADNKLLCELGDLPPMDPPLGQVHIIITVRVKPDTPAGTIQNKAQAFTFETYDPNTANSTDTEETTVTGLAHLTIEKAGDPAKVYVGEQVKYTVRVTNEGPSDAHDVTVVDTLPEGLVYETDSDNCAEDPPGTLTCRDGTLAPGETWQFDIWARVVPPVADGGVLTNTVCLPLVPDGNENGRDGYCATAKTYLEGADLSVLKEATGEVQVAGQKGLVFNITTPGQAFPAAPNYATSASGVTAGRRIRYVVAVSNGGPREAENVLLTDRLPPGVTIYPGSLVASQGSCETGTPGEPLDRMTCGLGHILPMESATLTFEVLVDPSLPAGTVLENDVEVTSDTEDYDNSDNHGNTQTVVQTWADTTITKLSVGEKVVDYDDELGRHIIEQLPGEVTAGLELRYEISVQNNGASDAQNVQVLDLLPGQLDTGLAFDPVTFLRSDGADCQPLDEQQEIGVFGTGGGKFGQVLWCNLGTLPAGARKTFHIYVNVDPAVPDATTLTNGAFVWYGAASPPAQPDAFLGFPFPQIPPELPTTDDPYLNNNFASTDTLVDYWAELEIEKWSEPQKVYAGEQKKYTIKVTNLGPSVAWDVAVLDTLPDGVHYEIDTAGCEVTGQQVDCDLGDMMPGEMREFLIWALVDPMVEPGTTLLNEACVGDAGNPPVPVTGNCAYAENLVLGKADLRITKFGKPDGEVQTGDVLTYTVVVDNLGPGNAWGVALKDILQTDGVFDLIDIVSDRPTSCTLLLPGNVVQGPYNLTADPWPPDAPVPAPPGVNQPTGEGSIQERLQVDCWLGEALGVLAADGPPNSGRWILTMRVRAFESQSMNNVADVVADTYDPNMENNHAEVLHDITEAADLKVEKSAVGKVVEPGGATSEVADEVTAGLNMTYTIEVTNLGPMEAGNVRLEDLLPVDVVVTGWSAEQGWCLERDPDNPTEPMTCELGEIEAGETVVVEIYVDVPPWVPCDSWLANSVRVYSDYFDPDEQNNVSDNLTVVNAMADLGVSKEQAPDIVLGGKAIEYTIRVWNDGPSDAPAVRIEDVFPAELAILSWECVPVGTGATCPEYDPDVRNLEYSFDLPADTYVYFVVHGVRARFPDWSFTNEVLVSTGGCVGDPDPSDNTDSDTNEPYMTFLPVIGKIRLQWDLPDLKVIDLWAEPSEVGVTVINSGSETVTGPFWVDLYIDPASAPRAVGQQWIDLSDQGAVWYVQGDALPLEPGDTLDLRAGDAYYLAHWSYIEWPIEGRSTLYAQVDSRTGGYGMVLEKHEVENNYYNNIKGPVLSSN